MGGLFQFSAHPILTWYLVLILALNAMMVLFPVPASLTTAAGAT